MQESIPLASNTSSAARIPDRIAPFTVAGKSDSVASPAINRRPSTDLDKSTRKRGEEPVGIYE